VCVCFFLFVVVVEKKGKNKKIQKIGP